ncbi:hypothetical protein ABT299_14050 [Spirillospora sp. NPDC000708]
MAPIGTALSTGMRVSLRNDSLVTPENPLHNVAVAEIPWVTAAGVGCAP